MGETAKAWESGDEQVTRLHGEVDALRSLAWKGWWKAGRWERKCARLRVVRAGLERRLAELLTSDGHGELQHARRLALDTTGRMLGCGWERACATERAQNDELRAVARELEGLLGEAYRAETGVVEVSRTWKERVEDARTRATVLGCAKR